MLAANFCVSVVFLLAYILPCAGSVIPPLTVVIDFEAPHSETSLKSLRQNLNRILRPTGIDVIVELKAELPQNPQFGQLVVFKMKGSCSMWPLTGGVLADEPGPLALAYMSDGQVLHFGEVECDRVRHSLQRVLGPIFSEKSQQIYGSALAVVIAHEVYHMLGNACNHTRKGLTKSSLSASELMNPQLDLPPAALTTIEHSTPAPGASN
jgi:hypothetical protein